MPMDRLRENKKRIGSCAASLALKRLKGKLDVDEIPLGL
jgi:hypothetical protein